MSTQPFNAGKVTALVTHSPEHFNRTCMATIPEYWEAEVVGMSDELLQHLRADKPGVHVRIYGASQTSEEEAVQDLIDELKRVSITSTLKIERA